MADAKFTSVEVVERAQLERTGCLCVSGDSVCDQCSAADMLDAFAKYLRDVERSYELELDAKNDLVFGVHRFVPVAKVEEAREQGRREAQAQSVFIENGLLDVEVLVEDQGVGHPLLIRVVRCATAATEPGR